MAEEPQTQIDIQRVINNLATQVANLTTDLAVKDTLIAQLQEALAEANESVSVEPIDD